MQTGQSGIIHTLDMNNLFTEKISGFIYPLIETDD